MNLATIAVCSMLLAGAPKSDGDKKLDAKHTTNFKLV